MKNADQRVIYGRGAQTIRLVPVDRYGRPTRVTSATYQIDNLSLGEEDSSRVVVAAAAATLGAVDTTLTAAAGPGQASPRQLTVASATGISEGRRYLLSDATRRRELVVVEGISGTTLEVRHSLGGAYASGSALQSIELEGTFPSSEADDEDHVTNGYEYHALWVYTGQGETLVVAQPVTLTRYSREPWVTTEYVVQLYPTIQDRLRGRASIHDAIACATDDFVAQIESTGRGAEYYRGRSLAMTAIRFRAVEYALRWCATDGDAERAVVFQERFDAIVHGLLTTPAAQSQAVNPVTNTAESDDLHGIFRRP